jgi:glucuronate isomerase
VSLTSDTLEKLEEVAKGGRKEWEDLYEAIKASDQAAEIFEWFGSLAQDFSEEEQAEEESNDEEEGEE